MLDIKFIRENAAKVKDAVKTKAVAEVDIDQLLSLDSQRRDLQRRSESLRARRNTLSSSIRSLSNEERPKVIAEVRSIKAEMETVEEELKAVEASVRELMILVPQVPDDDVPVGFSDDENVLVRSWGEPRTFDFEPRDHEELGELLDIIDKPRAAKFAGGRTYLLKGAGAMLEMAVMRLAMDVVVERGFTPVLGPVLVNSVALEGSGFFPLGREETYHLERDDKYLIGTSEVHLVSVHMDEILSIDDLPILYAGSSPCFRREAGSHGRDARGVYRVHQFSKVEQVALCEASPEASRELHNMMLSNSEEVLKRLGLPHRVMLVCSGEMGQGKAYMHDVETWMPSRGVYSETHSCSSLHDFQTRRLKIRYKDHDGKIHHCYSLNNTAVASPRILIPLLEHYQNEDGSVDIPEALQPYMYGLTKIEPKK